MGMESIQIKEYFEERLDRMIDRISELIDIESPSFDAEGVIEAADWIEASLKQALPEVEIERVPAEGRGVHLIARAFRELQGAPVFILGHIDTVHPRGSTERNPTRVEDGKLYGCGTFDMKANISLLLEVFGAMEHLGLKAARPVSILLSCDEEVGSATGRPVVEREAEGAAYCLIFEPSAQGRIKTGRKGTGGYTLRTHGVPAHAGLDPEKGASAVLEIAKQIIELEKLNDPEAGTTVTVGTIKGGTATNVVPENAECAIDVRFSSMEEARKIEAALASLAPFDKRVRVELDGEINRPPLERTEAVVRIFEKARGLAAGFGYEIGETQVGGASDGNFVGTLGVPVLDGLGITGDGAHRMDEHVLVSDIADRATLVTLLLVNDLAEQRN